jgi:starvation-inducible DNA-binding protein
VRDFTPLSGTPQVGFLPSPTPLKIERGGAVLSASAASVSWCRSPSRRNQSLAKEPTMKANIGISSADSKKIAAGLSRLLADSYTLYLKTHNFHWNVTGPMFQTLHLLFQDQYTEQWNALDLIAERIRALGHVAPGSYRQFAKLSSIAEEEGVPKATDMIRQLVAGQEAVARTARELFPAVEGANDQPTADLLTQRLQIHEKNAWMLRSLLG